MNEAHTVEILVTSLPAAPDRMFPSQRPVATLVSVAASDLRNALATEILAMARCFSDVDLSETRYDLQEVTFSLNVSAEGKVQIIGGIGVSSGAGLTVTLKRK